MSLKKRLDALEGRSLGIRRYVRLFCEAHDCPDDVVAKHKERNPHDENFIVRAFIDPVRLSA